MASKVYILLLLLSVTFKPLRACGGYTLKMKTTKNCVDNSVIKILPGFDVLLDNDCNLTVNGCIEITKPVKSAKGTYRVKKAPFPTLEGDIDFCDSLTEFDIKPVRDALTLVGLPTKCPFPARKVCGSPNKKVSIAKFKDQLSLAAGTTEIKLEAEHDGGGKSCGEIVLNFSKARRG